MFDRNGPRILIVENDPSVIDLLTTRLELAGYRTSTAKDGYRALESLAAVQPDGVVLDINMPNLDGLGVLKHIKTWPLGKRPPVLVLTANNAVEDVSRCISLGAKDYLSKPFKDAQLLARVARLVSQGRRAAETPQIQDDAHLI